MMRAESITHWARLTLLWAGLLLLARVDAAEDVQPLKLPALKPLPQQSFRGPIAEDAKINGFDVTGQVTRIATSADFLRLVPPIPLAYGGVFTTNAFKSNEWVVEIAMRVHGSIRSGGSKGGRGLGFWYTKNGSPTKGSKRNANSNEVDDSSVSFFGQSQSFDGLGIIFDTAPSAPLLRRSDPTGWQFGADKSGVISALIDDGKTGKHWFDNDYKKDSPRGPGDEAKYLDRVVGECEAAFRNAPGLVWVRIAHFDKQIRVDLDLQPHTSLSQEQRHFTHHCFSVTDVALPAGYHFGLTGLASGNTEPDSVDIYAFDAWEVVGTASEGQTPPPIVRTSESSKKPLAGTTGEGDEASSMLQEVLQAQARMTEAIDALSARLSSGGTGSAGPSEFASLHAQIGNVEALLAKIQGTGGGGADSIVIDKLQQVFTALDRQQADINALTIRIDNLTARTNKNLGTITSKVGEVFSVLNKHILDLRQDKETQGSATYVIGRLLKAATWLGVLGLVAAGGIVGWTRFKNRSGGGGRGKKMI